MGEECAREHSDLRVTVEVMKRDLDSIQSLLLTVTEILRDNLVTLSGHDKASSDWRVAVLSTIEGISGRVRSMEGDLSAVSEFNMQVEEFHEKLGTSMELMHANSDILRRLVGLVPDQAPPPLSRQLQETLECIREVAKRDPRTGERITGWALWYSRLSDVFFLVMAGAVLALAAHSLLPYITWSAPH